MSEPLKIMATWDDQARVWVAQSDDVPGLVAEAESPDKLILKLKVLIPELLELNGPADSQALPFSLGFNEILTKPQREAA